MADTRREAAVDRFWGCRACRPRNPLAPRSGLCPKCGRTLPAGPARGRWLLAASWSYTAAVLASLVLIRRPGDSWWPVTLLLFMPRWLFLAPAVALAAASAVRHRPRQWLLQGITAAVVAGPLMGLSFPVHRLSASPPAGDRVRIATFNMGLDPIRLDDLERWIERERLDVVCFQEGGTDIAALRPTLPAGWRLSRKAFLATRLPVVAELPDFPQQPVAELRLHSSLMERWRLRAPSGREFVVASVHLPSVREGIKGFLARGETTGLTTHPAWWGREMGRILSALLEGRGVPLLVGGDFNMPPDDSTLAALLATFRSAFDEAGWGYGYTRPARFSWVRIDRILTTPDWFITECRVGPDLGSDHLPVTAEVVLPKPGP